MASPVDSARVGTNITAASLSHTINYGSPVAGDLVISYVRAAGGGGGGWSVPTGKVALVNGDTSDASDDQTWIYYSWASGTEGATEAFGTVNSVKLAAIVWVITGAENPATTAPTVSTVVVGTAANINPGSVTVPGGSSLDALFLTLIGLDSETATATQPAGYSNLASANSGTGGAVATNCMIWGASKQATAASDDPAAWTSSAPASGVSAWTIAIPPPAPSGTAHTATPADTLTLADNVTTNNVKASWTMRRQRRASRYLTFR